MLEKKPVIDHPLQNQHTALYCQTQIWTDKENTFVPMLLKASITYLHPSDNGQQVKTDIWLSLCYPLNNEHTLRRYIVQEPLLRNKTLLKCTIQTISTIQHSNVRNKEALSSLSNEVNDFSNHQRVNNSHQNGNKRNNNLGLSPNKNQNGPKTRILPVHDHIKPSC